MKAGFPSKLGKLKMKYFTRFKVAEDDLLALDDFKFIDRKTGKDITAEFND
jgi:hypothetical protein